MKRKNIVYVLFILTFIASFVYGKDMLIESSKLPEKSKMFIKTYFSNSPVALAKEDGRDYKVILANGVMIDFMQNGDWKEIEGNYMPIPSEVLPTMAANVVKNMFPNTTIEQIEKEKASYKIKFASKIEIVLSEKGEILRQKHYK